MFGPFFFGWIHQCNFDVGGDVIFTNFSMGSSPLSDFEVSKGDKGLYFILLGTL